MRTDALFRKSVSVARHLGRFDLLSIARLDFPSTPFAVVRGNKRTITPMRVGTAVEKELATAACRTKLGCVLSRRAENRFESTGKIVMKPHESKYFKPLRNHRPM